MIHVWDPQLSDREVHFIGMICVQWSSLEHTVFIQTLESFTAEGKTVNDLPKEMNNIQFTGVLDLWKSRVAEKARGKRQKVLLQQYDEILKAKNARDALMHGMWHWSPEDLGTINTVRVKKHEVITSQFSADALNELARKVGEINFNLHFPGGLVDLAKARMQEGGYISRRALAIFTGAPTDLNGYPIGHPKKPDA